MEKMGTKPAFDMDWSHCIAARSGHRGNMRDGIDYGRAQEILASGGNPLFAMLVAARGTGHAG